MIEFHGLEHAFFALSRKVDPVAATADGVTTYDAQYGQFTDVAMRPVLQRFVVLARALGTSTPEYPADAIDCRALQHASLAALYAYQYDRPQVKNPEFWVGHVCEGLQLLLRESDRSPAQRVAGLLGRLQAVPSFLTDAQNTLDRPATLFVQTAQEVSKSGRSLLDEATEYVRVHAPDQLGAAEAAYQRAAAAFASFDSALTTWAQTRNDDFAVGPASFAFHLKHDHGVTDSIEGLWDYGQQLRQHCEQQLRQHCKKLKGTDDWRSVIDQLRSDHPSRETLVQTYEQSMEAAKAFVEQHDVLTLPSIPLVVRPTPAYRSVTTPFAAYEAPGVFSQKQTGVFSVTLPNKALPPAQQTKLIRDHCTFEIPVTSVHEGYPGHHTQLALATTLRSETRQQLSTPFSLEGWALYCEGLMAEQGFYRQPEEVLFVWFHLLWRAHRVLLDIGLHTRGVTYEQGVTYLSSQLGLSQENAAAEVKRYCADPTTQLCYAVGRRDIRALRHDYLTQHGKEALKQFHDTFLSYGGLPVSLVRQGMQLSK